MRIDDLIITIAYFSIPVQILVSLYRYPLLGVTPRKILVLCVLFAFFIFLCGAGHLLRCLDHTDSRIFRVMNVGTAIISLATALYLHPILPILFQSIDRAIQDLKEKEEFEEMKNRKLMTFMGFLCHEIRNPLFAITASVSFLGDDDHTLTDEQKTSIKCIDQSANLMLRLVNDVLDISKLDAGKLEIEKHQFALRDMIDGVCASIKTYVERKHNDKVAFQFMVADDVPPLITGDSARILQIVYNLLSNASKFTENGSINLNVSQESFVPDRPIRESPGGQLEDDAAHDTFTSHCFSGDIEIGELAEGDETTLLRFEVSDTGCGIAEDRLGNIFEPFSQAKISDYRKHGGTGLGLSIVAKLIRMMGGSIHVESQVNVGSKFVVFLPVGSRQGLGQNASSYSSDLLNNSLLNHCLPVPELLDHSDYISLPMNSPRSASLKLGRRDESATNNAADSLKLLSKPSTSLGYQSVSSSDSSSAIPNALVDAGESEEAQDGVVLPVDVLHRCSERQNLLSSSKRPSFSKKEEQFDFTPGTNVVLVTDDNALNRKLIGRMINSFNLEADFAENGLQACEMVERSRNISNRDNDIHYGFIIMDLSMPVMDGCTAVRRIRENCSSVPIMALSAHALEDSRKEAIDAGCDLFATKPIKRKELQAKCGKYLSRVPEIC